MCCALLDEKVKKKREKKPREEREERDISFRRFPEISRPRSPLRRAVRVASRQRPRPHGGRPRLENKPNVTSYERRDVFSFFFCSEMNWDEMYAVQSCIVIFASRADKHLRWPLALPETHVQAKTKANNVNGSAMDLILSDRLSHSPSITNKEGSVGWKGWPQISSTTFFGEAVQAGLQRCNCKSIVKQTETQPVFQLELFHTITLCLSFTDTSTCH